MGKKGKLRTRRRKIITVLTYPVSFPVPSRTLRRLLGNYVTLSQGLTEKDLQTVWCVISINRNQPPLSGIFLRAARLSRQNEPEIGSRLRSLRMRAAGAFLVDLRTSPLHSWSSAASCYAIQVMSSVPVSFI